MLARLVIVSERARAIAFHELTEGVERFVLPPKCCPMPGAEVKRVPGPQQCSYHAVEVQAKLRYVPALGLVDAPVLPAQRPPGSADVAWV